MRFRLLFADCGDLHPALYGVEVNLQNSAYAQV